MPDWDRLLAETRLELGSNSKQLERVKGLSRQRGRGVEKVVMFRFPEPLAVMGERGSRSLHELSCQRSTANRQKETSVLTQHLSVAYPGSYLGSWSSWLSTM